MKPTLTIEIGKETTSEQMNKAITKIYELHEEFALIFIMEGEERIERGVEK